MGKGIGGHQKTEGSTDTWFTPPEIVKSLGEFDLDPCSHINRPWDTAKKHYTEEDNSLSVKWEGRVWLNPPYNRYLISSFMEKMANHMSGIALIFARTETIHFHKWVFPFAESILFLDKRLVFHELDGSLATIKKGKYKGKVANSGAPSVLISYSEYDSYMIERSGIKGAHIQIKKFQIK